MTNDPFTPPPLKALRGSDVYGPGSKTGQSRSQIYRLIEQGAFPEGFLIARNTRAWFEHEIDAWLLERARKNPAGAIRPQLVRGKKASAGQGACKADSAPRADKN